MINDAVTHLNRFYSPSLLWFISSQIGNLNRFLDFQNQIDSLPIHSLSNVMNRCCRSSPFSHRDQRIGVVIRVIVSKPMVNIVARIKPTDYGDFYFRSNQYLLWWNADGAGVIGCSFYSSRSPIHPRYLRFGSQPHGHPRIARIKQMMVISTSNPINIYYDECWWRWSHWLFILSI